MSDTVTVTLFHPMWPKGRDFDPVVAETMRRQGWVDKAADLKAPKTEANEADAPKTGGPRG